MSHNFTKFRITIERLPGSVRHPSLVLAESRAHRLYYTPFEHLNRNAKLVVVGITPGPNQLELALNEVQRSKGLPDEVVLANAKKHGAFGSGTMRPNLIRMLNHFRVAERLGLQHEEDLWDAGWHLFQPTSVVPHAAFKVKRDGAEVPFAGAFQDILRSDVLRGCFEDHFLPSVRGMNSGALWVALGPTAKAALDWCVENKLLRNEQVAAFTHPSTNGGSQVSYFMRERSRASFDPSDPVLKRCNWLDAAYKDSVRAFESLVT